MVRNVSYRTLCNIVLVSLILCLSGILIDLDHAYYIEKEWAYDGWFHHYILSHRYVITVYGLVWGLITFAFAVRWNVVTIMRTDSRSIIAFNSARAKIRYKIHRFFEG